jgi:hypothetical protein
MNVHKRFLVGIFTTAMAVALALSWAGKRETAYAAEPHPADHPATHNMLMAGEETVYLSHLPMFQAEGKPPMPHRYQAILEVTFAKADSTHRAAGYVTCMSGGVGGERSRGLPLSR